MCLNLFRPEVHELKIETEFSDWNENGNNLMCFFKSVSTESGLHLFMLARGLPGGWLGVGWGFRGSSPSEPPGNPLETLTESALYKKLIVSTSKAG